MTVKYRAVKGEPPKIFDDFSLQIGKGEKIALIGSNGAGKSTMLKMMMGLIRPESGQVLLNDQPTADLPKEELGRTISMVYQNPEEMFIKDSIRKDIEYAMMVRKVEDYQKRTDELLEMFVSQICRTGMAGCYPADRCGALPWPSGSHCSRRSCSSMSLRLILTLLPEERS